MNYMKAFEENKSNQSKTTTLIREYFKNKKLIPTTLIKDKKLIEKFK